MMAGEQFMTVNYIMTQTNLCRYFRSELLFKKPPRCLWLQSENEAVIKCDIQRSHLRFKKKSRCPRMTANMQEPFRQMGAEHLLCGGPFICIVPDQSAYDRFCMRRHLVDVSVEYMQ
jgi:hypothetical protein